MSTIEIVTWKDVNKCISEVNPRLGGLINDIKGVDKFHVIRATYPFGEDMIDKGEFFFNLNGQRIPLESDKLPKTIKKLLDYHWEATPFGILTKNSIEFYINRANQILPSRLLLPGKTFSLLSIFENPDFSYFVGGLYSTKAGCRSLLMLPKITHELSSARLTKKYGITRHLLPKTFSDHWHLFNEIVHSRAFKTSWEAEIHFFSKDFLAPVIETLNFRHGLLYSVWQDTGYQRNVSMTYNFIWSLFFDTLPISLRNDAFIIQTVKHLILIALAEVPGFVPEDSNISGPITELMDVFLNDYKIRFHLPVFMRLQHYDGQKPAYYSLYKSTFIYEPQERGSNKQTINDLIKIRSVLYSFLDFILGNRFEHSIKNTAFFKSLANIEFDFYHPDGNGEINNNITEMVEADPRFTNLPHPGISKYGLAFPIHSNFFRGCVRIRPKKLSSTPLLACGRGWM